MYALQCVYVGWFVLCLVVFVFEAETRLNVI
jgi:hypothetical protein